MGDTRDGIRDRLRIVERIIRDGRAETLDVDDAEWIKLAQNMLDAEEAENAELRRELEALRETDD